MNENEIKSIMRGHEQRNQELLQNLRSKGVAVNNARSVEHHFWANSQREAALLAKELYERGFLILALAPAQTEDGSDLWNVEAGIEQTPEVAASKQTSDDLTRLAARFESTYDGWGTSV